MWLGEGGSVLVSLVVMWWIVLWIELFVISRFVTVTGRGRATVQVTGVRSS